MRHSIADALTFARFPLAVALFVLILHHQWMWALVVFIVAILTDAFDGIAARRWPPKPHWWRKHPHEFDNAGDSLLFFAVLLGLAFTRPVWWWVVGISAVGTAVILFFIAKLRPSRAERLDVVFGWCFGALLLAMLMQITVLATDDWVTTTLLGLELGAALIIVGAKWDRATSRPEVVYTGTW